MRHDRADCGTMCNLSATANTMPPGPGQGQGDDAALPALARHPVLARHSSSVTSNDANLVTIAPGGKFQRTDARRPGVSALIEPTVYTPLRH
jgi:hypothetical protein